MQVRFTTEARLELRRILDLFLEYAGPMSAEKFGKSVDDQIAKLVRYPEIGQPSSAPCLHDLRESGALTGRKWRSFS